LPAIEAGAELLSVELTRAPVRDAAEVERAIDAFAREPDGGLVVFGGPATATHRELIIALSARHRLPVVCTQRVWVTAGALASYGVKTPDLYRRAASYVDRILKGEKTAALPVQQATKFELVINLKTAKALGLTVPITLLGRADEVIE
jgi:putative tryptophan/tyrosine transport system substrate-binding protein